MKKTCSGNSIHASNALRSVGVWGSFLTCMYFAYAYGGERTAYRSRFSPSPMWALGFELGSLELATSAFTSYIVSMILGQFSLSVFSFAIFHKDQSLLISYWQKKSNPYGLKVRSEFTGGPPESYFSSARGFQTRCLLFSEKVTFVWPRHSLSLIRIQAML